ncbi:MAG: hypothetical protein K2O32_15005 [Acetatifactor sp.]|nr:hypothetical protein [Acetatifactor sp.]
MKKLYIMVFLTFIGIACLWIVVLGKSSETKLSEENIIPSEESIESEEEKIVENDQEYTNIWGTDYILEIGYHNGAVATQEDIIHIGQLSHLKHLKISVDDNEIDLSPLGNLSELESLDIHISCLRSPDLSFMQRLTQLKELSVTVGYEVDLSPIGSLTGLKQLTLNSYGLNSDDLSFLKNLNELTEVFIGKWDDIKDLSYFQDMPRLKSLWISYVGDVDLYCLSELKNLETLHITGEHIRNIDGLGNLINIKELYLTDNSTDAMYGETEPLDLQPLTNLTQLERIGLADIYLEDIEPLASLKSLYSIDLINTKVEDISSLAGLESLDKLYI